MNIQIIGTRSDPETRKAERFFKERTVPFHFVDLTERPLSRGEIEHIARAVAPEELVDRDGARFKRRSLAHMEFDPAKELAADPLLLRTPIVRNGAKATVGEASATWARWIREARGG